MFCSQNKSVARMLVIVAVLFAVTVMVGCSQEQATPESKEASLKRLAELSGEDKDEDKAVEKKSATAPAAKGEASREKQ